MDSEQKVIEALKSAYFEKGNIEIGDFWKTRVMGHIHELSEDGAGSGYFETFGRVVLKMSPVLGVLVMISGGMLIFLGADFEYEMSRVFLFDPPENILDQLFRL